MGALFSRPDRDQTDMRDTFVRSFAVQLARDQWTIKHCMAERERRNLCAIRAFTSLMLLRVVVGRLYKIPRYNSSIAGGRDQKFKFRIPLGPAGTTLVVGSRLDRQL